MHNLTHFSFLLSIFALHPVVAQVSNPIPEPIPESDITMELEDFVTLPASTGGGGGRARLSVMRSLPDGRLFVNDQRGQIYTISQGSWSLYINLRTLLPQFIDSPGLGTGFHSFAFSPDYLNDGKLYTVHSEPWNSGTPDLKGPVAPINSNGQISVISEWTTNDPDASQFTGTRKELFRVYFPGTIHAAQEIAFNPNATPGHADYGLLYVCLGEGKSFLENYPDNEHRLDSPMGTVLRIDPNGNNSANGQYGIPGDNPWADTSDPSYLKEIYAYGFRNPHRISWDTGGTGRAYIGDIGEKQVEEVNLLMPGADYGFPEREGYYQLDPNDPANSDEIFPLPSNDAEFGYTYPVSQYDHDEGFAIALGPVYRGSAASDLSGQLLFGDIKSGRIFFVPEADLQDGSWVQPEELSLSLDGVLGSLTSFVGNDRADLRFGTDNDGELYIMTKTDGKVRKVVGSTSGQPGFSNDPARWIAQFDFEGDASELESIRTSSENSIKVVRDPFGGGGNHVAAMSAAESNATFPIDSFPIGAAGSLYFRFAIGSPSAEASFIVSRLSRFSANGSVVSEITGQGTLSVKTGTTPIEVTDTLRPGIWYEAWVVFPPSNGSSNFNLYIRGDHWTATSLLASKFTPSEFIGTGLQSLMLSSLSGDLDNPSIYLDDIHVDPSAANASSPTDGPWALVSNFESDLDVSKWTFVDVLNGSTTPSSESVASVVEEDNGNFVLSYSATETDSARSHALAPLPRTIIVSDVATIYGRAFIQSDNFNQVFGLVNVPEEEIFTQGYDALDVIGRWSDESTPPSLLIRDSTDYNPAEGTYAIRQWYEYWFVVRNGGEASGGQTFDVHTRVDGSASTPDLVYENALFRLTKETPMEFFQIIANLGFDGYTAPVLYDDIYYRNGVHLERPEGTGYGLYPGKRGSKDIPFFGSIWDELFPWVYHSQHGWLYVLGNDPNGAWHYDTALGWVWISPNCYPYMYATDPAGWVYYLQESFEPRWFYDFNNPSWMQVD